MAFQTLVVHDTTGVELSYIDSGAPANTPYTTIFAIHGMNFTNLVFERLLEIAPSRGVRVVAINRRPFPGSTPFTQDEVNVTITGGDEERDAQMEARGHEIGTFIATFIQRFSLPPPSDDKKTGGVCLLGWSVGALFQLAAIATADTLPEAARSVLSSHIRSLILYEPGPIALGLPMPAQNWNPLVDTTVPEALRLEAFGQWVTSYFDHANVVTQDLDSLSWVVPSLSRPPTIFGIPAGKRSAMYRLGEDAATDLPFLFFFANQILKSYRKACYDPKISALFPQMKRSFLCGDKTAAFGVNGMWAMKDDQAVHGPKTEIVYKMIRGTNHFGHWDDPEQLMDAFLELV